MFQGKRFVPLVLAVSLLAPGYGGSTEGVSPLQMLPAVRGQLLNSPPARLGSFSVSDLLSRLSGSQLGRELIKLAFSPTCSVDTYHLEYDTVGARGEATTASAALMIPTGSHPRCQGPRPIVLYAHGKRTLKSFNIADLTSQSNEEGLALATVGPARGYIVVAPNYAGYDTSSLDYHPYLDADRSEEHRTPVTDVSRMPSSA